MSYHGFEPSKVAITVGQGVIDASHIQDESITTVDISNDAITANQIDDDGTGFQMGTLGLGGAVSGSEKLTVTGTASFSGAITTTSTFDGVDIATRDAILTSTTTTAGNALPKAGGTMTGVLTVGANTDGHDVTFYGNGNGKKMVWDESADKLIVTGAIETADLILNNNRGHYTIVEEEDYLSIKNEKTGKKYKFVLEEIE